MKIFKSLIKKENREKPYFLITILLVLEIVYLEFPEDTTALCLPTFKDFVLILAIPLESVLTVQVFPFTVKENSLKIISLLIRELYLTFKFVILSSKEGTILDLAVNLNIIEKSGSWFSYNGDKIGQGRENVKELIENNPKMAEELEKKIRDNFSKAFENALGEEEIDSEDEELPEEDEE